MPPIAQISEKASDPAAWSDLAKTLGVGGFFGLIILLLLALGSVLLYRSMFGQAGFLRAIIGDLHSRAVAFLAKLEASVDRLEASAKADRQSQDQLRVAGQQFASGMSAIADRVHADVRTEVATIQATLQRSEPV